MAKIIGIDLGTSNSAAAVMIGGKPTLIPAAEGTTIGGKAFPSVVAFTKDGELLVGEPARRQAVTNPIGTIMAAKRKMGTNHIFNVNGKETAKAYFDERGQFIEIEGKIPDGIIKEYYETGELMEE